MCPDQPCFRCSQPFYFTFCLFTFISPCSSSPAYSISLQCPTNPHIHNPGPLGLHPCKVLVFLQVCLQETHHLAGLTRSVLAFVSLIFLCHVYVSVYSIYCFLLSYYRFLQGTGPLQVTLGGVAVLSILIALQFLSSFSLNYHFF